MIVWVTLSLCARCDFPPSPDNSRINPFKFTDIMPIQNPHPIAHLQHCLAVGNFSGEVGGVVGGVGNFFVVVGFEVQDRKGGEFS